MLRTFRGIFRRNKIPLIIRLLNENFWDFISSWGEDRREPETMGGQEKTNLATELMPAKFSAK